MNRLTDEQIRELYRDPRTGLQGDIANFAKRHGIPYSRARKALASEDSYNLNVEIDRRFPRRSHYVSYPNHIWEADLVVFDAPEYLEANNGYQYVLVCIDQFSRAVWAKPLKTKRPAEVVKAFEAILEEAEVSPTILRTDRGGEFMAGFETFLKERRIKRWLTNNNIKCSQAERFNRTLRGRVSRLWNVLRSRNWVDRLEDIIFGYNTTPHRSLRIGYGQYLTPGEAQLPENRDAVYNALYAHLKEPENLDDHKYNIGDHVRIPYEKTDIFTRTHHTRISIAVYKIKRLLRTDPPTYELEDLGNPPKVLRRKFYEPELVKIAPPEWFDIESIKEREFRGRGRNRKEWLYVKYLGYPDNKRFNEWIPAEKLKDYRTNLK